MKPSDKIRELMAAHGHNGNKLAELSGVPQPTINRFLSGKHKDPKTTTIERLIAVYGMSYADFLRWNTPSSKNYLSHAPKPSIEIDIPILAAVGQMGNGEELVYEADQIVDVLRISKDWVLDNVRAKPTNLRIITGAGDSMSPTFSNGDLLFIDVSQTTPDVDGVYVLSAHNRLFIKRVRQRLDGRFEVSSDNPTVKTVDLLDGTNEVTVHGRVVWAWNGKAL